MAVKNGFTLIEILVSISVLTLLMGSALGLFFRTFRAGGRTGSDINVEQNAQITLNVIDRLVKNAQSVDSACPSSLNSLTLTNRDGLQTIFTIVTDSNGVNRVASNGAAISTPEVNVTELTFVCAEEEGRPEQIDVSLGLNYASTKENVDISKTFTLRTGLRTY